MKLKSVKSSMIKAVGYNSKKKELYVKFKTNEVYTYYEFPKLGYTNFITAPSLGKFFIKHIKDKYNWKRMDFDKQKKINKWMDSLDSKVRNDIQNKTLSIESMERNMNQIDENIKDLDKQKKELQISIEVKKIELFKLCEKHKHPK